MSEFNNTAYAYDQAGLQSYVMKVFIKMGLGLLVTALVAAMGYYTNFYINFISATGMFGMIGMIIAEFAVVIVLSAKITKLSPTASNILFFVYAIITGFTFSVLLMVYNISTVFLSFAFAALLFGSAAVIGATTHRDLTKFSTYFMGGLFALVIATVVCMFIPALRNSLLISYLGIVIFLGLTAWDMQKIKNYYIQSSGNGQLAENMAVYGALQLYLDFINIFLYVLRILGRNSNN